VLPFLGASSVVGVVCYSAPDPDATDAGIPMEQLPRSGFTVVDD